MTNRCTPEQKQHMIDLIQEARDIVVSLRDKLKDGKRFSLSERRELNEKLTKMKKEMIRFRKDYPDD